MNTNTETQTINATQTESGEKLFTQEQVNQIVSERLARERSKAATEQATTDREKALDAREQALKCRELVAGDKRYPAKLLDVLDTADFDSFKAQADKLLEAFPTWAIPSRSRVHSLRPHRSLKSNRTKTS